MTSGTEDNVVRVVANIFISFMGAGILGLPYAFKKAGVVEGTVVMAVVCYLSVRAMLLLIDCKYKVEEMWLKPKGIKGHDFAEFGILPLATDDEGGGGGGSSQSSWHRETFGSVSYSDVAYAAFGPMGRLVIDSALLVSQVGFCCAYLIFISDNMASCIHGLSQPQILIVLLPPLFLLTLIPDLINLAIFSLLAQISNLFAFAVVFWFDFEHLYELSANDDERKEFSVDGFPFFFSVAIYCFEGAGMILSIEASVSERLKPRFKKYFVRTVMSLTALFITFGVSGYMSYGEATKDIITLNLRVEDGIDFAVLVKACLCFSLFCTYPIMLFPVTMLLQERFLSESGSSKLYANVIIRLSLVSLTGSIVLLVPQFSDLMALIGATCCTLLGFIMPGLCHMVICKRRKERINTTLNYVLVVIGAIGAVVGTLDAISNITT